jgi:hypothetical protein
MCIVSATVCTFVVLGENGVYLIFGLRWPRAVLFFGGLPEKLKIYHEDVVVLCFYSFLCVCTYAFKRSVVDSLVMFLFAFLYFLFYIYMLLHIGVLFMVVSWFAGNGFHVMFMHRRLKL